MTFAATLIALTAVVLAWNVTWNVPVSLFVDTIDLKVYWEQNCTTPVTTIDFGNIEYDGNSYSAYLYIKNEGLGAVTIHWNSTRSLVTSEITDFWEWNEMYWYNLDGHTIGHDAVLKTRYRIAVSANVTPGSYSWTLYLGAEQ